MTSHESVTNLEKLARLLAHLVTDDPDTIELLQGIVVSGSYLSIVITGATTREVFSRGQGGRSSLGFWKELFPKSPEISHLRCDVVATILGSSFAAFIMYHPETIVPAFLLGLGANSILNNLLKRQTQDGSGTAETEKAATQIHGAATQTDEVGTVTEGQENVCNATKD